MINPANTTNSSFASWGRDGIWIAFGLVTGVTAVAAEALGYVQFGTIFIGGFLAAGGAFLGILGLRLGRRLSGTPKEERRG